MAVGLLTFWCGCSSDDESSLRCELGGSQACSCPDGSEGTQKCDVSAADWGACECGAGGGSGGTNGGSGGSGASGGSGNSGGSGSSQERSLTRLVDDGPWLIGQWTTGIAVDREDRIYVNDRDTTYRITADNVEVYLVYDDLQTSTRDIDIDQDGTIYLLTYDGIFTTDAPHTGTLHEALDNESYKFMGLVSPDVFVLTTTVGTYRADASGITRLYPDERGLEGTSCATEDLTASYSGQFLRHPGCNGSTVYRAHVDGSGRNGVVRPEAVCRARHEQDRGFWIQVQHESTGRGLVRDGGKGEHRFSCDLPMA